MSRQSPSEVSPYYLRMARHWRMGARSSDLIRQRLIRRGITFEETLRIIQRLDEEEQDSAGFLAGRALRGRLWMPMGGARSMSLALSTRTSQARAWLMGYLGCVVLGMLLFLLNRLIAVPMLQCDLVGFGLTGMGLAGLLMYGINSVLWRFL